MAERYIFSIYEGQKLEYIRENQFGIIIKMQTLSDGQISNLKYTASWKTMFSILKKKLLHFVSQLLHEALCTKIFN